MIKKFKVAGHIFSIETEIASVWDELTNYSPFEIPEGTDSIFSLKIVETLPEYEKQPYFKSQENSNEPRLDLFKCGEDFIVEMAPIGNMPAVGRLFLKSDFSEGRLSVFNDKCRRFAIDNCAMLMFAFRASTLSTIEMHASVVASEGKAYLFLAPSGTGKSTHSRMWLEAIPGTWLLNDDNPIVKVEDGEVVCYGSPWSGKTPCYKNEKVPVGAFVRISRNDSNFAVRQNIIESYASISSSTSGLRAISAMADGLHSTFESIVSKVPCFVMNCLPNHEAAVVCKAAVSGAEVCCAQGKLILPNNELIGEISKLLDEGHSVELMTKGNSMLPFIIGERDSVLLKKKDSLYPGEIVLAKVDDRYVLHRIFSIDGDSVTLMGDGNICGKEHCLKSDVCGTVLEIIKPSRRVKPGNGIIWKRLLPIRRYLLYAYRHIILPNL